MSLVPERTDRAGDRAGGKKDGSDFVGTDGSEKNPLKSVRSRKIGSRAGRFRNRSRKSLP